MILSRSRSGRRAAGLGALLLVATGLGLGGCSGGTSAGLSDAPSPTRPGATGSLVQRVRAAGQVGNELDVQPLRDPQVEDLRVTAAQAERQGDFSGAGRALKQALLLSPNDPDLLQWQAELALAGRDWRAATQLATRSYASGPKLGGLCRRNWTTIQLAAQARGDGVAAAQAQSKVDTCTVAPPTRM
jgi:Flp pilus assembly protein TadD